MNIRRTFTFIIPVAAVVTAAAAPLSPRMAYQRALGSMPRSLASILVSETTITEPAMTLTTEIGNPAIYLFMDQSGFVITSADDQAIALLGYGDRPFDISQMPPAMKMWLDIQAEYVSIASSSVGAPPPVNPNNGRQPIAPLLKTTWDQGEPYSAFCPVYKDSEHCVTGCTVTAAAQVLNYHAWPETGVGSDSYTDNINGINVTLSADFGNTTYDWANMPLGNEGSYTTAQRNAVGTLMKHLGVATHTDYASGGGNESASNIIKASIASVQHFRYSREAFNLQRDFFADTIWENMIYAELAQSRPVLYAGYNRNGSSGHAFVCDGYQNGRFHFNWGWSGYGDGYFRLDALEPGNTGGAGGGDYVFSYGQLAMAGLVPDRSGDSAPRPTFYAFGGLKSPSPLYKTGSSAKASIAEGGIAGSGYNAFYNYSAYAETINAELALRFTDVNDPLKVYYTSAPSKVSTNLYSGYYSFDQFIDSSIPEGDYTVEPVVRATDHARAQWFPFFYPNGYESSLRCHMGKRYFTLHNSETSTALLSASGVEIPEMSVMGEPFTVKADITSLYALYNGTVKVMTAMADGTYVTAGKTTLNLRAGATTTVEIECSLNSEAGITELFFADSSDIPFHEGMMLDYGNSGIDNISATECEISYNETLSAVTGPEPGITVYSTSGVLAASSTGNTVDVSALQPGIYLAVCAGQSRRIVIR